MFFNKSTPDLLQFITLLIILGTGWNLVNAQGAPQVLATRSPVALKLWAKTEIRFYERVNEANVKFQNGADVTTELNWYLTDFENSHKHLAGFIGGDLDSKAEAIASNPIASYLMARRVTKILRPIWNLIKSPDPQLFFPRPVLAKQEVDDCLENILRIIFFYDVRIKDFCNGNILGVHTGARLNSRHCWEISRYAKRAKLPVYNIQFLEEALERRKVDGLVDADKIQEALYIAYRNNDDLVIKYKSFAIPQDKRAKYVFTSLLVPMSLKYGPFVPYLRRTSKEYLVDRHFRFSSSLELSDVVSWEVCKNGDVERIPNHRHKFCWLETRKHSYWNINPLRMEFISRDPDIIQIYNALGPKKIKRLMDIGSEGLRPASTDCGSNVGDIRNSLGKFIEEEEESLHFIDIQRLAEKITGLRVRAHLRTKETQVSAYSFGGHYAPHPDTKDAKLNTPFGSRVATFMLLLEEPKRGGFTAFPQKLLAAKPVKGSALLWYNTFSDGTADDELEHCACPVVLGSKWIVTKWISYYDQLLIQKCGLKPKERLRFIPNA